MAKKKIFIDNPVLQFISTAELEETRQEEREPTAQPKPTEKPPAGYKINPLYVETKSRRLQLLLQ